jgi:hypothetical protein
VLLVVLGVAGHGVAEDKGDSSLAWRSRRGFFAHRC